MLVKDIDI